MAVNSLIIYYSRTGATKALADALATELSADKAEIECRRYRRGAVRYLLAGFDSVRGRIPPIDMPEISYRDYDLVLVGTPIWTSHPALPIRAFFAARPSLPDPVGLFTTYGGHSDPEIAITEMAAFLSKPPLASLSVLGPEVGGEGLSDKVSQFAGQLVEKTCNDERP